MKFFRIEFIFVVGIFLLGFLGLNLDANAIDTVLDDFSCSGYGGIWESGSKKCSIGNISNVIGVGDELIIPSGVTLQISNIPGVTLSNNGLITIYGELIILDSGIAGITNDVGTISNFGKVTISNLSDVGIFNNSLIINSGLITISNSGSPSLGITQTHTGTLLNSGILIISNSKGFGFSNFVGTVNNLETIYLCGGNIDGFIPTSGNPVFLDCPPILPPLDSMYASAGPRSPSSGQIILVDPTNAATSILGDPTEADTGLSGLAFDFTGNLWGSEVSRDSNPSNLLKINPETGTLVQRIPITSSINGLGVKISDLAVQPSTNILYGTTDLNDFAIGDSYLLTIDKNTGVATPINQIGDTFDGYGIAFSPDGTLYTGCKLCGNQLYTLDPISASILTSVTSGSPYEFKGLGVRSDGTIFVISSGGFPLLYTIDPTSGLTNTIGFVDWPLSDLAFAPSPLYDIFDEENDVQNVQCLHYDKIIFKILNNPGGKIPGHLKNNWLDIKVLDDPNTVSDIKGKIKQFMATNPQINPSGEYLDLTEKESNRLKIQIKDVDYSIDCFEHQQSGN